jgi:hypothetical protein
MITIIAEYVTNNQIITYTLNTIKHSHCFVSMKINR